MTVQTWLVDVAAEQCEDLLAGSRLGRLGVVVDGRPEIFPVNHVFDRTSGCVAFPTNAGTKLHAALDWPWVAYEVDGVEADGARGWSVLVVGRAEEVTDLDDIDRLALLRHVLWRRPRRRSTHVLVVSTSRRGHWPGRSAISSHAARVG